MDEASRPGIARAEHMTARTPIELKKTDLQVISLTLRQRLVTTSAKAKIPHLGSCLSCVELLVQLYWQELRIDPLNPEDQDRDRFLLSKGHGAPILFQVLAERGFFPLERLEDFGKAGSVFHEHPPKPGYIPGIEAATGSLGHGLPMALGMALAARIRKRPTRCYALLSDGECNEGSIWEAAMMAAAQKVNTLTAIIDFNKWQATGRSQDVMALDPLPAKWEAFGWHCQEIDGHDLAAIANALGRSQEEKDRPSVIVAHTVKGKGISFMEDDNNWHYRTPNPEELAAALAELESV
jgi:transketolase